MDGEHSRVRIILPALGKIDAWLWTSWAEQGQVSSTRVPSLLMTKTKPLQSQEVLPLVGHTKQLSIPVLKLIASVSWPVMDGEDQQEQMPELNYL